MKKLVFILSLFCSLVASAQTDSSKLTSGPLTLRVNDWELAATYIAFNQSYEDLYDSIKIRARAFVSYPAGTTNVSVSKVNNGEAVALARVLLGSYTEANASAIGRIITALKGMTGQTWVNTQITAMQARDQANFTDRRTEGRRILRKQ